MAVYRTMSGDTWDLIAYKTLGDGMLMDKLIAANVRYCETFVFSAGIVLDIPELDAETSDLNPPWYGGG